MKIQPTIITIKIPFSFNRTILELKLKKPTEFTAFPQPFNRTILELKLINDEDLVLT